MRKRAFGLLIVAGLWTALVAGCGAPATVDPAPEASTPVCAEVLRALPDQLSGQDRRSTNSQATAAWGDPAITLRCGVPELAPTTDECVSVKSSTGEKVDWVVTPAADAPKRAGQFTTYGRSPAIEVTIPRAYAGSDASSMLVSLGPAISLIPADHKCL